MKRIDTPSARPAFTLVELLVVMGVIVILMTLIVPAATTILKGTQVTSTGQEIASTFALARQTALAQNRSVEVRFYQYIDPSLKGTERFRAYQLFGYDEAGTVAKPLNKVQLLPVTIVLEPNTAEPNTTRSTLLGSATERADSTWTTTDPKSAIPRVGTNYKAFAMRYRPDGSTTLPAGNWFLTLRAQTDLASPPKNFVTIQVNRVSGAIKSYHP